MLITAFPFTEKEEEEATVGCFFYTIIRQIDFGRGDDGTDRYHSDEAFFMPIFRSIIGRQSSSGFAAK